MSATGCNNRLVNLKSQDVAVGFFTFTGASVYQFSTFNADSPSMKKITRYIDKVANSIPNGPTQTHSRHQVSPPYPSTALPSPSSPTLHRPSTSIHTRSKGSSMNHARRWIRKNITKPRRCMSFAQLHITTADLMRCRPDGRTP